MNYSLVKQICEYLVLNLSESCQRIEPAGSFRRKKADCGDLELVCIPKPGAPRPDFGQKRIFTSYLDLALFHLECGERLGRRIKDGEKYKQIIIRTESFGLVHLTEFKLDLFIVRPETWGVQFAIRTGPAEFSHRFVTRKNQGGLLPNHLKVEDGLLWDTQTGSAFSTPTEFDFFKHIGLPWIEPEDRQSYLE